MSYKFNSGEKILHVIYMMKQLYTLFVNCTRFYTFDKFINNLSNNYYCRVEIRNYKTCHLRSLYINDIAYIKSMYNLKLSKLFYRKK